MYRLDTNVVSELRKIPAGRADPAVHHWSDSIDPELLHITLGFVDCRNRPRAQPDVVHVEHNLGLRLGNAPRGGHLSMLQCPYGDCRFAPGY